MYLYNNTMYIILIHMCECVHTIRTLLLYYNQIIFVPELHKAQPIPRNNNILFNIMQI